VSEHAQPLVWTLSATDERGNRTTLDHDRGEGTVRVVELDPVLDLLEAQCDSVTPLRPGCDCERCRALSAVEDFLRVHGRLS
jgi:hypothetical protein